MSPPAGRPQPRLDGLTGEFYGHCARGQLSFQRCDDCARWRHPPRVLCAGCASERWSWQPSSGRGTVFTWTVTHQPFMPALLEDGPYAVLVVEMEEGPRVVSQLREMAPDQLRIGLPLEVVYEQLSDEVALPCFRPRSG